MEKGRIKIDFLKDSDNEAILDLSHRCIQKGMISGYPDRTPFFSRIHKQIDNESFHIVARQGEKIIGCIGAIYTPVHFEGRVFRSVYLLDFKVDPDFQKGLTAYKLVKELLNYLVGNNQEIGFATFIKGNESSRIFVGGRAGFPGSSNLGDVRVNNIIPFRKRKIDPRFKISNPGEDDIAELVELYRNFYRGYKLAPHIDEELFRFYTDEIDGMDLSNFWIARENGRIKAVLCSWDENIYKRWMVISIPFGMKLVLSAMRFLSIFIKMPAAIKPGNPLKQKTLAMLAHDNSLEALRSLIMHANNMHLGSEYTVLQTHFHKDDPMIGAQKGLFSLTVDIEVHIITANPDLARKIAEAPGPVLFEWPIYI